MWLRTGDTLINVEEWSAFKVESTLGVFDLMGFHYISGQWYTLCSGTYNVMMSLFNRIEDSVSPKTICTHNVSVHNNCCKKDC